MGRDNFQGLPAIGTKPIMNGFFRFMEAIQRKEAYPFLYDVNGVAYWPGVAIDYTGKTQFLFKINKGIKEISDNIKINEYIPKEKRPVPFEHMIYFGDGETDIPSMKMVKDYGGHSIAVYGTKEKQKTAKKLIKEDRVNFICNADYRQGKDMHKIVKRILFKIRSDYDFNRLLKIHEEKGEI
ncbi:MAG: hypothetical protein IJ341_04515 [Bacteroidales bacterium]|nr:hypothetical protein [Bacteroidales bacterium]MBQ7818942.1 hypothetical protein [Bacteroidales bacterium]